MLNIGCHLSISKGFYSAGKEAVKLGGNTFQFFTRNPRGGNAKALDTDDLNKLKVLMEENNFAPILAHAPYTLNMCSENPDTREFAKNVFADDLERLNQIPKNLYVFHPGSHTGQGVEVGINYIVETLNFVLKEEHTTTVLLEAMSGKGSEIGRNFEELKAIIDRVDLNEKLGVCIDTCHIYSGGYDIVNDLDGVLDEFDRVVGLDRLKAIHLNDSMMAFGSNKDRHAKIGERKKGLSTMENVINHEKLKHLPFFLETPNDNDGYKREIELLRSLYRG